MLIEFRLQNYRCFKEEQILSLVASPDKSLPENILQPASIKLRLLRSVLIYGPNASGKTTILQALSFVRRLVLNSGKSTPVDSIDTDPFLLDSQTAEKPSVFELTFVQSGVRYQYGFAVDRKRVQREYLYAAPRGRTVPYFQRDWNAAQDQDGYYFGPSLKGPNESIAELTGQNTLYLSRAATLNHPVLVQVFRWFEGLQVVTQKDLGAYFLDKIEPNYRAGLRQLLNYADLGIVDFRVKDPKPRYSGGEELTSHVVGEDIEVLHETADHRTVAFKLSQESNGTRHILYLGQRILEAIESGGILAVDELDASLHPLLVRAIVQLFHNPEINTKGAQLIFNTHDTTLLDPTLFRRDQIWFTEKGRDNAASLYSLLEYSPRKNESLAKGYLQGRYGALPFLGDPTLIFAPEPHA